MTLTSNWKITFRPGGSPIVLVNYGDEIDAEPTWPLRKGLSVINLVDADAPFLKPMGNAAVTLAFKVFSDETLDKDARQEVMESLLAWAALGKEELKIEINGITDRYWKFADAYVTEHTPIRWMEAGTARVCKSYSVTATGLEQVGP